jgi:hypothetical protein
MPKDSLHHFAGKQLLRISFFECSPTHSLVTAEPYGILWCRQVSPQTFCVSGATLTHAVENTKSVVKSNGEY